MPPKTEIVVLQYNNSSDTIKCLESLAILESLDFNILVVDNASEIEHLNNVRLFIESQNKTGNEKIRLIANEKNLGYAGGNNIGIKYSLEHGAEYILILNNDTTVPRDILNKLLTVFESGKNVGMVAPAINEGNRTIFGGKITWLKPELEHIASNLKQNDYLSGACLLVKAEVFEKIGFLDERYFLYFEDADFCLRAKRIGFKLATVTDAIIDHHVSSTTNKLGSPLLLRYHYRNAHLFNWKNGPLWVKILLPFWSILVIIKQSIKMVFSPVKRVISRQILLGVIDFYKGRFGKIIL